MASKYLKGSRIAPPGIDGTLGVADLIDGTFLAYNAGKLQKACRLFVEQVLQEDVVVGMSLSGALTPAGLGRSCLIPLIEAGFVDWIVSTGANLYHDLHHALDLGLHRGSEKLNDVELHENGVVRIYDILLDFQALVETDLFVQEICQGPRFQTRMSTPEFHYLLGEYVAAREEKLGVVGSSVVAAAHRHGVPLFVSSPGDSSIGMNLALLSFLDRAPTIDVSADVNQSAGIVWDVKRSGGRSAAVIWGGGSPKNFLLQTEPQIQEVLGFEEKGHDFFLQFTDARPDTGGLSGATPAEAVSWGKVDPEQLSHTIVTYTDSTLAMPLLTSYALERAKPRKPRRLMDRLASMEKALGDLYRDKVKKGTVPFT